MAGQRKALIVATDEYEHEGLQHLLSPAADAEALRQVLADPRIGEFDVVLVHNEPSHIAQARIEDLLSDGRPDDVLLLHFSCHGLKSEAGELFFAARNTRPNRLGSTAISADFVQRCMRASRSRSIVLLLDCCYGGAFSQGVQVRASGDVHVLESFPGGKLGGGRGRAVITASSAMEYAFEGDQLADDQHQRPSVFTAAVVDGLATGEADRDEDGWVSLNELYDYVFDRVRDQNPHQTPSRQVEMQGELYLARSRRRRIRPLPLPPDLEAARTDPNMYTRIGAVSELRARLTSENLPAAVGAYEALTEIASTDVRYVAEAATAALGEAVMRTVEQELPFGQIPQGSSPAHRTIHLLGPPLTRACTFEASADWIRVVEIAEGLDVSVDTSVAGRLQGRITLTGPTGEAAINIDVEVTPIPPQRVPTPKSAPSTRPPPDLAPVETPTPARQRREPRPSGVFPQPTEPRTVTQSHTGTPTSPDSSQTPRVPADQRAEHPETQWWFMPLLPILAPVPFIYAAVRLHDRRLWLIASAYIVAWMVLVVLSLATATAEGVVLLWFVFGGSAAVHAFILRDRLFADGNK